MLDDRVYNICSWSNVGAYKHREGGLTSRWNEQPRSNYHFFIAFFQLTHVFPTWEPIFSLFLDTLRNLSLLRTRRWSVNIFWKTFSVINSLKSRNHLRIYSSVMIFIQTCGFPQTYIRMQLEKTGLPFSRSPVFVTSFTIFDNSLNRILQIWFLLGKFCFSQFTRVNFSSEFQTIGGPIFLGPILVLPLILSSIVVYGTVKSRVADLMDLPFQCRYWQLLRMLVNWCFLILSIMHLWISLGNGSRRLLGLYFVGLVGIARGCGGRPLGLPKK